MLVKRYVDEVSNLEYILFLKMKVYDHFVKSI